MSKRDRIISLGGWISTPLFFHGIVSLICISVLILVRLLEVLEPRGPSLGVIDTSDLLLAHLVWEGCRIHFLMPLALSYVCAGAPGPRDTIAAMWGSHTKYSMVVWVCFARF